MRGESWVPYRHALSCICVCVRREFWVSEICLHEPTQLHTHSLSVCLSLYLSACMSLALSLMYVFLPLYPCVCLSLALSLAVSPCRTDVVVEKLDVLQLHLGAP